MRKKTTLRLLAPVLALIAFGTASNAHAQSTADKAAAEALFQAGRSLMTSGRFAEACPKFEASNRLDSGLGTLLFLADCYEKAGRAASAWATFREAESIAMGRSDQMRAQVARDRAVALEPRLSKLWIKVDAANDPKIVVTRDGEPVPQESWGIALPTDAGEHLIEANAPGRKTWSSKVVVAGEAANVAVEVPALEVAPVTPPPPVTPVTPPSTAANTPADQGASSATHTQKTLGIVIGAVGIASLGVGTYFGLHAKAKRTTRSTTADRTTRIYAASTASTCAIRRCPPRGSVLCSWSAAARSSSEVSWCTSPHRRAAPLLLRPQRPGSPGSESPRSPSLAALT